MSGKFSLDDTGWKKFASTGSVYDYLKYRDKIDAEKNSINQKILSENRGVFCEDGSKWNNNKGSGA